MNETTDLKKLKYRIQDIIYKEATDSSIVPELVIDQLTQDLLIRLTQEIWSKELGETSVSYPANWIEAIKERWLPIRWRQRWPVRYIVQKFKMSAIYPDYRPPTELGRHNFAVREMPKEYLSHYE